MEAGIVGQDMKRRLEGEGFTIGHEPVPPHPRCLMRPARASQGQRALSEGQRMLCDTSGAES